jgi:hypothetical protein
LCGRYTEAEIQPDGVISENAVIKPDIQRGEGFLTSVWNKPSPSCLQWEFDPTRLEEAVSQLVGQHILMGGPQERPAGEVISIELLLEPSTSQSIGGASQKPIKVKRKVKLETQNLLTKETATSLLHLLHHISDDTT